MSTQAAPPPSTSAPINTLLTARSIAIIGASDNGVKASGRTLRYLKKYGFSGSIYPINPTRTTVQGLPSFRSVSELPEVPDIAVVVLPQSGVEDAIRQCGEFGIKFAIVFASGFAEIGGAGIENQRSLAKTAAKAGVRVLGPNSVGAVSASNSLTATFMTGLDQDRFTIHDDGIAFISQSGAMGGFILNMAQSTGIGVGRFVSTGNEVDLAFPELMHGFASEESTRVILGYVEGIRDGEAFQQALQRSVTAGIPVCIMKVGRSDRGAEAAASHTGALAGSDAVFDGVFSRYGVQRAESVEHLLDLARIFSSPARASGPKISIVTLSGGAGALMTDYAEDLGLEVFPWSEEWKDKMREILPSFASFTNPIDTTGAIASDQVMLDRALRLCLENPETDILMVLLGNLEAEEKSICASILDIASTTDKPILVTWVGGSGKPLTTLSSGGVPTFADPLRAMRAASALVSWSAANRNSRRGVVDSILPEVYELSSVELKILDDAAANGKSFLDEVSSKSLLASAGVPGVREAIADSPANAVARARELGHPSVLKLLSDEVAHKSDIGGVRVGLASDEEVHQAASEVFAIAEQLGLRDRRVVLQQLLPTELELILGMKTDPTFGPVTMIGLGGVLTEVVADIQVRPSPVTVTEAREMINTLRGVALLRGVRGRRVVNEEALATVISNFSHLAFATSDRVESIDVNPLLIAEDGTPVAVDALVVLKNTNTTPER